MTLQITIAPKVGRRDQFEIVVEGEKWCDIHRTIFGSEPRPPIVQALAHWSEAFNQWEYQAAKKYVLWRLSQQSYHSEQLAKLLRERFVQLKTIQQLIQDIQAVGYLDDNAWINTYVNNLRKRYSDRLILQKLKAKGLSIQEIPLSEHYSEKEAIQQLLSTRYRQRDLTEYKDKQKVVASLMRKGFHYEHILAALDDQAHEIEESYEA